MKKISWTTKKLDRYQSEYSPSRLMEKLKKYGKQAGAKVVYYVLLLYYALKDGNLSFREKAIIFGALGYFILPFDIIPDFVFGGYLEDYAALIFALNHLRKKISPETSHKARERVRTMFPDEEESEWAVGPV